MTSTSEEISSDVGGTVGVVIEGGEIEVTAVVVGASAGVAAGAEVQAAWSKSSKRKRKPKRFIFSSSRHDVRSKESPRFFASLRMTVPPVFYHSLWFLAR